MIDRFSGLDPAIQAAIIGAIVTSLVTVAAGVAGLVVLIWRLHREAAGAIREMRAAEAMKLKLRIYEEQVIPTVEKVIDAEVALSSFIRRFETDLTTDRSRSRQGRAGAAPVARVPALIELNSAFSIAAVGIVTFVETWLVVDPRLSIFQTAINAAVHDARTAWGAYFERAMRVMPVDLPDGLHWTLPDAPTATAVISAGNDLIDYLGIAGAYAADFRTEMQSLLIGPLFGNPVSKRKPIDPRYAVITLEDAKALDAWFDSSPWGLSKKATEQRVRAGLQPPSRVN